MSCIEGGPAARAGIREGDELLEIDGIRLVCHSMVYISQTTDCMVSRTWLFTGENLGGMISEVVAQKLRGRAGTVVTLKVHPVKKTLILFISVP